MKKASYKERDYAFGQLMLRLRTTMSLTQAGLAEQLGVSRHAVGEWEAGLSYPKAERLKHLILLGVRASAFAVGHEEEEIRALWKAARQKVQLDEAWFHDLLASPELIQRFPPAKTYAPHSGEDPTTSPRIDWIGALDVSHFAGREVEVAELTQWIVQEHCRVVMLLGMGGIGKSLLASFLGQRLAPQFEAVLWRSVRDAPVCEDVVADCITFFSQTPPTEFPPSLELRINQLLACLQARRCLLVLDNLETLLESGDQAGGYLPGYEGYGRLIQRLAESAHQSCVLLTSREKPAELVPLEGNLSPVRTMRLAGLDTDAGTQLLVEKDVVGTASNRSRLVEVYKGNPLALKIVAQTIVELFNGEIHLFLEQGKIVFGGVRELLHEQFERLSALEQSVLLWLAILREPVSLGQLLAVLSITRTPTLVLEALDGLRRRSLIEQGHHASSFTLQSVVLEYATARLVAEASREIEQGHLNRLLEHGLCLAQAKEYVRQTQEHLLVLPLLTQLQSMYPRQADLEERFLWLLDYIRSWTQTSQGYGPANIVALLRVMRGDLRGLDLSRLTLRGIYLQGVEMQDVQLSGAVLQDSIFTESFDAIAAVTISRDGQYWATASWRGEVRVWGEGGQMLHRVWQAHIASGSALAFSPDGRTLASGGWDNTVKLWDVASGTLLWTRWQTGCIRSLTFSSDGHLLASGGDDTFVHFWDSQSGTSVQMLAGQGGTVYSLAWSPDGSTLAGGCSDGSIWVWKPKMSEPDIHAQRLSGHTHWVTGLAFSPDGTQLASASWDQTIKLWDITSANNLQTILGHTNRVQSVAWSPDGYTLASAGFDKTILLWDVRESRFRTALREHTAVVSSIAFTPDSHILLSGSNDGTVRVWDVESGQCLRMIGGYVASLFDLDWSPDGTQLASGGADTRVTIWDGTGISTPRALQGHHSMVFRVTWNPDKQLLASGGYDNRIGIWDTASGVLLQMLRDTDAVDTIFLSIAWSPDGSLLACGSYLRGVLVWDIAAHSHYWVGQTQRTTIRCMAWSRDGTRLAVGGDYGYVYVWDIRDGTLLLWLAEHQGSVMSIAWSPDGTQLASTGGGREGGELFVWKAHNGERVQSLTKHPGAASAVAWSPDGKLLISGGSDGRLRWWEVGSGACLRVQEGHQGTVQALKVSPDGSRIASCGDDGVIRLWNLHRGEYLRTLSRDRPYERLNITGIGGLSTAQKSSLHALGAFEETSIGG